MGRKTRKHCNKKKRNCDKDAKKGTQLKCRLKTSKAIIYQSIYGAIKGGSARATRQLFY